MSKFFKILIMIFVVVYVISPIDACPGPIDDVIVTLLGLAARKGIALREEA